jgi:high-affinity nickel-transport protein
LRANLFDDDPRHARAKSTAVFLLLLGVNFGAWLWAWRVFADRPALIGTALLAYMFGLRHAFDADHIAAIDNVVRKLMQQGKRPFSVGFFFSLGHSTIVVLASVAIAATATLAQQRLIQFRDLENTLGTTVSALFLVTLGLANSLILKGVWTAFIEARSGRAVSEQRVDELLAARGLYTRIFGRLLRLVSRSWHMYAIGFLFGLGFDTATEVGVLGISAVQAVRGIPIWSILVFQALFTAGMSLVDTADSAIMVGAYSWAFLNPIRKLWYNLTITAASVAVAVLIGGIEALVLLGDKLGLDGAFWGVIGNLNDNLTNFGFAIVGVFIASWVVSAIVYRVKSYDDLPAGQS